MSERAFISIGSNINPELHIPLAVARLAELGHVRAISNVYENQAIGPKGQPDFLNAAVLVDTDLPLDELLEKLSAIEDALGRVRTADKFSPRTIDLDVCLFGDLVRETPRPVLPDPDILTRGYLAVTLAELDPGFRHPVTDESLAELAARVRTGAQLHPRTDVLASIVR